MKLHGFHRLCLSRWIAAVALAALVVGCGTGADQGSAGEPAGDSRMVVPGTTVGATEGTSSPTPVSRERKPAPRLTSIEGGPHPADELKAAYFHWNEEVVTVGAYPSLFGSGPKASLQQYQALRASADEASPELAECQMATSPEGDHERGTPIVVQGKLSRSFPGSSGEPRIALRECEVVSQGESFTTASSPWVLGDQPIPLGELHEAVFGWQGERVQVSGRYHSTTYSSAGDQTRHDLSGSEGKAIACSEPGNLSAPASAIFDRDGVIVEGTIAEPFFEQVGLTDCRFLNRA